MLAEVYSYWAQSGETSKWDIALTHYQQALSLFPGNTDILNSWAQALVIRGDIDTAEDKLDSLIEAGHDNLTTTFTKSILYSVKGYDDEAAALCLDAIESNPRSLRTFMTVCDELVNCNCLCSLQESLMVHAEETEEDWAVHAALGVTSLYCDGIAKSLEEFDRAMFLIPDEHAGIFFYCISAYTGNNDVFKKEFVSMLPDWEDKLRRSSLGPNMIAKLDRLLSET
jgi:tetratricopeptide (TPR) repeat protein